MSSYQQLCELIDTVKAEGHRKVTVTVLPSGVTRKRKSLLWITVTGHVSDASVSPSISQTTLTLFFFIMSREVLLGMLSQGNTGDEILAILDAISEDVNNTQEAEIQF